MPSFRGLRGASRPAALTHAYDQAEVVAGAGTLAREIEREAGLPDSVLVSVGRRPDRRVAAWFEGRARVLALEPEGAPTLYRAREAGAGGRGGGRHRGRFAGGAAHRRPGLGGQPGPCGPGPAAERRGHRPPAKRCGGSSAWPSSRPRRWAWRRCKAAPTGRPSGEKLCLILCGANFDPATLA
jgi:threonine dehydratase